MSAEGLTTKQMLEKVLNDLKKAGDIDGSAIITRDGLLIASDVDSSIHAETFAAMSATMLGAAETATLELKKGALDRVIVESKDAKIIAGGAGEKALLVVMTSTEAGLGLILVEMNKAAEKIEKVL